MDIRALHTVRQAAPAEVYLLPGRHTATRTLCIGSLVTEEHNTTPVATAKAAACVAHRVLAASQHTSKMPAAMKATTNHIRGTARDAHPSGSGDQPIVTCTCLYTAHKLTKHMIMAIHYARTMSTIAPDASYEHRRLQGTASGTSSTYGSLRQTARHCLLVLLCDICATAAAPPTTARGAQLLCITLLIVEESQALPEHCCAAAAANFFCYCNSCLTPSL
jgi:hypothetical protein